MANRQRAEARRKAAAKAAGGGNSKLAVWITLGVVILAVVVGLVFALGGDDDSTAGPGSGDTEVSTDGTGGGSTDDAPDSQPVTVEGDTLPLYSAEAVLDEAVGMPAPVIKGLNFAGEEITIDAAADGPTMIVFLAHWCPHCNAEVPVLLDWQTLGGVPDDLNVIGVATAVAPGQANYPPADWFEAKNWPWPVLVDEKVDDNGSAGKAAAAYGATGWPYIVVIGADGEVKVRVSGEKSVDDLNRIITEALAG